MVGLDVVQRIMEAASETNILFVDACRDNPLSRNLARAMGTRSTAIGHGLTAQEAGAGTLISFSTQPGNVALDGTGTRNSPYAGALARHIATQGKDLTAVLVQVRREVMATTGKRQIPWEHSALTAEVMLASGAPDQTSANPPPKADASEKNASDGTRSDAEPKTALNKTSEPEAAPGVPKQKVLKVDARKGTLKVINKKNNGYLYDQTGRKVLVSQNNSSGTIPTNEAVELPSGRYYLKSDSGLVTVKSFEIKPGENIVVDFKKHVGLLRVTNSKEKQYLYNEADSLLSIDGTFMSTVPSNEPVELPPGRYYLRTGNPHPRVTAELFEIKAGEETVIDFGG